jgi:hypothetical protein
VYNTTERLKKEWNLDQGKQVLETDIAEKLLDQLISVGTRTTEFNDVMSELLTPFQEEYFYRLSSLLDKSDDIPLDHFLDAIAALEKQIEQNAPTIDEAESLLYAMSVARHSADYWHRNIGIWDIIFNSDIEVIAPYETMASFAALKQLSSLATRYSDGETNPRPHRDCLCVFYHTASITDHHGYTTTTNMAIGVCPPNMYFHPELAVCDWFDNLPEFQQKNGCFSCLRERMETPKKVGEGIFIDTVAGIVGYFTGPGALTFAKRFSAMWGIGKITKL